MNVGKNTDLDIRKMQEQLMSEDDRNHLFGTYNGSPIGFSLDNRVSHLNLNALVLSGSGDKAWNNYVLPNILAGKCSAVIMGKDAVTGLEDKGIKVRRMDFESGHSEARYNPFKASHVPSIVPKELAQLSRSVSLAKDVYNLTSLLLMKGDIHSHLKCATDLSGVVLRMSERLLTLRIQSVISRQ